MDKKKSDKKIIKKIKEEKVPLNSTLNLALTNLKKENVRPKGNIDKLKRQKTQSPIKDIPSTIVLRKYCDRLMNSLHQKMHHTVAIRVSQLTKLIEDGMPTPNRRRIIDNLVEISKEHGFDFFKP